jgi:hypothetical protein
MTTFQLRLDQTPRSAFGRRRVNVSLSSSNDGGRSWSLISRVHTGPSAYSSICRLPTGPRGADSDARAGERAVQLGILYEGGKRKEHYAKQIDFVIYRYSASRRKITKPVY